MLCIDRLLYTQFVSKLCINCRKLPTQVYRTHLCLLDTWLLYLCSSKTFIIASNNLDNQCIRLFFLALTTINVASFIGSSFVPEWPQNSLKMTLIWPLNVFRSDLRASKCKASMSPDPPIFVCHACIHTYIVCIAWTTTCCITKHSLLYHSKFAPGLHF